MHAQYFALLNLILKLRFCGEASLEFPFFNFPAQENAPRNVNEEMRMIINNIGGKISAAPSADPDQKNEHSNQGNKYIPSLGQPNRHGNKTCYLQELGKLRILH